MSRTLPIAVDVCVRGALASAWSQMVHLEPKEAIVEVRRLLVNSVEVAGELFLEALGAVGTRGDVDFSVLSGRTSDTCQRQLTRAFVHAYLLLPPSRQSFCECDAFVRRVLDRALNDASEDIQFVWTE